MAGVEWEVHMTDITKFEKLKELVSMWNGRPGVDVFADLRIACEVVETVCSPVAGNENWLFSPLELTLLHNSVLFFQKHCTLPRGKTALMILTEVLLAWAENATKHDVRRYVLPLLVPNLKPAQLGQSAAGLKFRTMRLFAKHAGPLSVDEEMNSFRNAVITLIQYHTHTFVADDPQRDIYTRNDLLRKFHLFDAFVAEVLKSGNEHDLLPTIS